ncbi:MAG: peptidylprolyl isomerase [Oscillospiraceae bacterium]|nr:peptidylprolyl isomerase [Oscillospiraceae bacterium]
MKKILTLLIVSGVFLGCTVSLLTSCEPRRAPRSAISDYDYSDMDLSVQLAALNGDEEFLENRPVAVITTCQGEIRLALFPEFAPNTVAAFIARVQEGFYDDSEVLAIQDGVFFQAGTDSGGNIHPDVRENEYSVNMWPLRGAVGAYGTLQGASDSRFFIVHEQELAQEEMARLREMKIDGENTLPEELLDVFEEVGVAVTLSGFFTFFGQVISTQGFETVEAIINVPATRIGKPTQNIRIIKIELE